MLFPLKRQKCPNNLYLQIFLNKKQKLKHAIPVSYDAISSLERVTWHGSRASPFVLSGVGGSGNSLPGPSFTIVFALRSLEGRGNFLLDKEQVASAYHKVPQAQGSSPFPGFTGPSCITSTTWNLGKRGLGTKRSLRAYAVRNEVLPFLQSRLLPEPVKQPHLHEAQVLAFAVLDVTLEPCCKTTC